jgi:hypothetical protein
MLADSASLLKLRPGENKILRFNLTNYDASSSVEIKLGLFHGGDEAWGSGVPSVSFVDGQST